MTHSSRCGANFFLPPDRHYHTDESAPSRTTGLVLASTGHQQTDASQLIKVDIIATAGVLPGVGDLEIG